VLVFVGVVGEGVEICVKFLYEHRSVKFDRILEVVGAFFWIVLVIGLMIEFREAAKSDIEAANTKERAAVAENEAGQANERASKNELAAKQFSLQVAQLTSTNLGLEKRLLELKSQIAETSTNVAKIDPLNLPIVFATADVELLILGTNSIQGLLPQKNDAELNVERLNTRLRFKDPDTGDFPVSLGCDQMQKGVFITSDISGILIHLEFKSDSLGSYWRTDKQSKKWGDLSAKKFDDFKEAEISIIGLLDKAKVRMGTCSLKLNSTIERNFSIDLQTSKDKVVLRPINRNSGDGSKKQ
jgi:hypothetical protein